MKLIELLRDDKARVVEAWMDRMLATYPAETAKIWKKKNQWTNPVGHLTLEGLGELVDEVVVWQDAQRISSALEKIIKVRAVQDFTPSKALAFVFFLKRIARELFAEEIAAGSLDEELALIDSRVDNMALMAFDIYTRNREQLFEMRIREFKNAHHMVFKKAGIMCGSPREALGLEDRQLQDNGK